MTPKEKAEWLMVRFFILPDEVEAVGRLKGSESKQLAKQCAIICVEQIMEAMNDRLDDTCEAMVTEYWMQVLECLKQS